MNITFQILSYCIPAIIVGGIAYYFFSMHLKNEENSCNGFWRAC